MKISRKDAFVRKVDDSLVIEELFNGKGFKFDFVISTLNGKHPKHVNHVSDRMYFILSGNAEVMVGDDVHHAETHDLIVIPANTPHGIEGTAEVIIITSPPFDPKNENEA